MIEETHKKAQIKITRAQQKKQDAEKQQIEKVVSLKGVVAKSPNFYLGKTKPSQGEGVAEKRKEGDCEGVEKTISEEV